MKKKVPLILFLLCVGAVGTYLYLNSNSKQEGLSDEEIKAQYCHLTAVVLETDVYCRNPDLYRQHAREGNIIEN